MRCAALCCVVFVLRCAVLVSRCVVLCRAVSGYVALWCGVVCCVELCIVVL